MALSTNSEPSPATPTPSRTCSAARLKNDGGEPRRKWTRLTSILCGSALLTSCQEGPLDPHGPIGQAERVILYDATGIMLAVVIPVIVLTLLFAWWFR
jgi:cytochrome o ubiquinol oxidase subunit 2